MATDLTDLFPRMTTDLTSYHKTLIPGDMKN